MMLRAWFGFLWFDVLLDTKDTKTTETHAVQKGAKVVKKC